MMLSVEACHFSGLSSASTVVRRHERYWFAAEPVADVATFGYNVEVPTVYGQIVQALIVSGLPFMSTLYSKAPIFAVPVGRMRFCALMAFTTSSGESPLAWSALVQIYLNLPLLATIGIRDGRAGN